MPELAQTACSRCREQKVKCTREVPTCARCGRMNAVCNFPEPPNRKLLATYRAPYRSYSKKRRTSEAKTSPVANPAHPSPFAARVDAAEGGVHTAKGSCADIKSQLSTPVQKILIDVYFTHMYNAWLLFHRSRLLSSIEADLITPHVLVSIFATATIFLPPDSTLARANASLLEPLGDLRVLGQHWATQAGVEALPEIIDPSLESVQTCQILALFWFSVGHSKKNTMFSGIAYKAACVLGLDSPPRHEPSTENSESSWLESEFRRRIFWATWLTNCINSEHYTVGTSVNPRIMNLPLPIDELSFCNGVQVPLSIARGALEEPKGMTHEELSPPPSIMAEIVKLMMIWAAIGDYLEARKHQSSREALVALFELEGRLSVWSRSLHPELKYSKRNLYKQLVVEQQPAYIFVHALHYQCCLVLHSSLVPQFSGLSIDASVSVEVVSVSARVALRNAQAISELGSDLIALDWDLSRIAPFVGYCIYVSASIHIVFLFSRNEALAALARIRLISNLKVLNAMKGSWSNLERLWARIHILYEAQTSRVQQTPNGGSDSPDDPREGTDDIDNIDMLAQKERDTGRLEEPLATSVLEYSLRLKPVIRTEPREDTIRALERMIYNDPLARIADREYARARTRQAMPGSLSFPTSEDFPSTANYQSNLTSTFQEPEESVFSGELSSALPSFLLEGGDDWWQSDLDDLAQAIRPYNDLFDISH